jgi:putative transposase
MARLSRLALAGHAHYVIQRGHSGGPVFADEEDRRQFLAALRESSALQKTAVHAYALCDDEVQLLLTPTTAEALSRTMQSLGRRYVSAFNRRHGRSGTLWDGRYHCAVVEPGAPRLAVMQLIDGLPGTTGASHRSGDARDAMLVDPPEFWQLGNTPFEREAVYRTLLVQGAPRHAPELRAAVLGGWAIGSSTFLAELAVLQGRPTRPRPRGRPRAHRPA